MFKVAPATFVTVVVMLVGCSSEPTGDGPLDVGGAEGTVCAPSENRQAVTIGLDTVVNESDSIVMVDDVSLIEPDGLALDEAYVVPIVGKTTIGVRLTWPPYKDDEFPWRDRQSPGSARVEAGDKVGLVVGVRPTGPGRGYAEGLEVQYSQDGDQFVGTTTTAISVVVPGPCN